MSSQVLNKIPNKEIIVHENYVSWQLNRHRVVIHRSKPFTTSWHMQPTMAATEELSAPPESGSKKPDAPLLLK